MAKDIRSLSRYNESTEQTEIFYPATTTDAIAHPTKRKSLTNVISDIETHNGAYNISAANSGTTYADLTAALGTNGANIPEGIRKGGMSVKFVQTSDNKYVEYFLTKDEWSINTDDWQGVDEFYSADSINLIPSNNVFNTAAAIQAIERSLEPLKVKWFNKSLLKSSTGKKSAIDNANYLISDFIPVTTSQFYYVASKPSNTFLDIAGYSSADENTWISTFTSTRAAGNSDVLEITIPSGVNYIRLAFSKAVVPFAGIWKINNKGLLNNIKVYLEGLISVANLNAGFLHDNEEFDLFLSTLASDNIIDPSKLISKKYIKTGTGISDADSALFKIYNVYIPVVSGDSISVYDIVSSSSSISTFGVYNKNKQFIRGIVGQTYSWQDGDAYVIIGFNDQKLTTSYPTHFANIGNTLKSYSEFCNINSKIDTKLDVSYKDNIEQLEKNKLDKFYGINLIDPSKLKSKKYIDTGGVIRDAISTVFSISDFIPVNGQNICSNARNSSPLSAYNVYAADKTTLIRTSAAGDNSKNYTYQEGDFYVVFSFDKNFYTAVGSAYVSPFASYGDELEPYEKFTDYKPLTELEQYVKNNIPEKITASIVSPDYVYSICDDVKNYSVGLYADHFFNLPGGLYKLLFKSTGLDKIDIFAPIDNSGTNNATVYNTGVNKKEASVSDKIVGDVNDVNISFVHRSILNSYTSGYNIKVLCIGDSVTAGTGSQFPKEKTHDSPFTYWRIMNILCADDKKNHSNTGYRFLSIGKQSSVTYTYDGVQYKTFAEGRGGWNVSNYLNDQTYNTLTNLFYDANKTWTGEYADELNAAGVKFSLASYLAKYKTLADDGETRLVVGSTAGTEITNINECDVCTPNIIVIQLSHNNTETVYEEKMPLMIKAIRNEFPNIPIILSAIDETGCYNQNLYPQFDTKDMTFGNWLHSRIIAITSIIKQLTSDFENVWYCPSNFIQPTAYSITTRDVNRPSSLIAELPEFVFGAEIGAGPYAHPSSYAHAAWAYEILACIKWVLSEQN